MGPHGPSRIGMVASEPATAKMHGNESKSLPCAVNCMTAVSSDQLQLPIMALESAEVVAVATTSARRRARIRSTAIRWAQVHTLAMLKLLQTPTAPTDRVIDRTSILRMRPSALHTVSSNQLQLPRMALECSEVVAEGDCEVSGGRGEEQQQAPVALESPEDLFVIGRQLQRPRIASESAEVVDAGSCDSVGGRGDE